MRRGFSRQIDQKDQLSTFCTNVPVCGPQKPFVTELWAIRGKTNEVRVKQDPFKRFIEQLKGMGWDHVDGDEVDGV